MEGIDPDESDEVVRPGMNVGSRHACAFVEAVDRWGRKTPCATAFENSLGEEITYGELRRRSDIIALPLLTGWGLGAAKSPAPGAPVVVYGHKSPWMLVCFLACVKSGHAYVPVDTAYPRERVANIVKQLGRTLVIDTTDGSDGVVASLDVQSVPLKDVESLCSDDNAVTEAVSRTNLPGLAPDDTFYVLFTSGSTGTPKGVEVTAGCVDAFMRYTADAFPARGPRVWFDRAAFSFDLSLSDYVMGLSSGDRLFHLAGPAERDISLAFSALAASDATDWVSTASFVDLCLADEGFSHELLPHLRRMLFVGETLRPETVLAIRERFPLVEVVNGYGPTESTDFVSACVIDDDMLASGEPLPVGYAKPGTDLLVLDPDTLEEVPRGTSGELFIVGDTVAKGYWGRPDQTAAAFSSCPPDLTGGRPSFRTGDEVTLGTDGLLRFHGRLDLQVKLHGFRIELGDIESCLCATGLVRAACVLPVERDGVVLHLTAFVVPMPSVSERGLTLTRRIKALAKRALPAYMVPSSFKYLEVLPLNQNGKCDRKALARLLEA